VRPDYATLLYDRKVYISLPWQQAQANVGRQVYERVVPMAVDHEHALLDALSVAERRELMRIIDKLQGHVKKLWGPC
jgi:hypothetical protein